MAKTFDLNDPDQYQAYLEESALHWLLYGGVYLGLNQDTRTITLYEPDELAREGESVVAVR